MATPTFTPPQDPSYGLTLRHNFNVNVARFGDNYSQRMRKGINSVREEWSLTWEDIERVDAIVIEDFLKSRGGTDVFWWTQPAAYPTDLPPNIRLTSSGISIGGIRLAFQTAGLNDQVGRKLYRCTALQRVLAGPLTDTVTATFEQEFDLGVS